MTFERIEGFPKDSNPAQVNHHLSPRPKSSARVAHAASRSWSYAAAPAAKQCASSRPQDGMSGAMRSDRYTISHSACVSCRSDPCSCKPQQHQTPPPQQQPKVPLKKPRSRRLLLPTPCPCFPKARQRMLAVRWPVSVLSCSRSGMTAGISATCQHAFASVFDLTSWSAQFTVFDAEFS